MKVVILANGKAATTSDILTNDLKKGDRIQLRNGWYATICDNLKGNTRLCDVEGYHREMGSVYSWDIIYKVLPNGDHVNVSITKKQAVAMQRCKAMGF